MTEDNPLNEMYSSEQPYDRHRVVEVLSDFVQVDEETGEPSPERFPSCYSRNADYFATPVPDIAAELGEIEEHRIPADESWLDDWGAVDEVGPGFWQLDSSKKRETNT